MRLIDRDLLLSEIEKSRGKNPHKDSKIRVNHTIEHDHIAHLVLEQPIVYDVDKVVERLEEYAHSNICNLHNGCPYRDNEDINCENCGAIGAVEIVKSGGIE